MRFFERAKNYVMSAYKMVTLQDARPHLKSSHWLRIGVVTVLNLLNTIAKILAPASLAEAVEMVATGHEHYRVGSVVLRPADLMYISVALISYIKIEPYIKKIIAHDLEKVLIANNALQIVKASHALSLHDHYMSRIEITKTLMEVFYSQSKLVTEFVVNISQTMLDIGIGASVVWWHYGSVIGGEFLAYCVMDLMLLSNLIDVLASTLDKQVQMEKRLHKFINHEYDILTYEETVRLFNHEKLEVSLSKKYLAKYLEQSSRYRLAENVASLFKTAPALIANVIPITFMLRKKFVLSDLNEVMFLMSYVHSFGGNLLGLNHSVKLCFRAIESMDKMDLLIRKSVVQNDRPGNVWSSLGVQLCYGNPCPVIEFNNVIFFYPGSSVPTLNGLTFKVHSGAKIGIIGKSNAGKSTIAKLLLGHYSAQSGIITLNGYNINDIPRDILANLFGYVPQNAELFKGKSIKYNVLYGTQREALLKGYLKGKYHRPHLTKIVDETTPLQEQLIEIDRNYIYDEATALFDEVMHKVSLSALINNKADAKDSTLSLSGGQRQRASIARALAKHSNIFIFDEPTSGLDTFTEVEVIDNIERLSKDKTMIMITHRLSTLKKVDEIIVIENGKNVEQGEPSHLLAQKGIFYRYYQSQMC